MGEMLFLLYLLSGCFKSKETDFGGFIKKIHISRYMNPIFMFFMSNNLQYSVVLEYIFVFNENCYFLLVLTM